jgi:hypothetical protein
MSTHAMVQTRHTLGQSYESAHRWGKAASDRYIWFGNDPIRVIALSPTPMAWAIGGRSPTRPPPGMQPPRGSLDAAATS